MNILPPVTFNTIRPLLKLLKYSIGIVRFYHVRDNIPLVVMTDNFALQRQQLGAQLAQNGIKDARVLHAFTTVPRELFVDDQLRSMAYANQALPLVLGQTISQPFIVGIMTQALQTADSQRVLEIGTGSGYQTAILSQLTSHVYSIERHAELSEQAARHLAQLGYDNVSLHVGDGSLGWPAHAPYDRILVTAAAPHLPMRLVAQLVMGGLLIIPIGDHLQQDLRLVRRVPWGKRERSLGRCVFVPLIGEDGW
jgi:protein-L-isoaspartate(D-aspartate) O-methyltransferase